VVKKHKFAKRTQIENPNALPISWLRKYALASFSKRTHFPILAVQPISLKAFQTVSKRFKAFQRFWRKNFFRLRRVLPRHFAPRSFTAFLCDSVPLWQKPNQTKPKNQTKL
jgi:hypothetical protein